MKNKCTLIFNLILVLSVSFLMSSFVNAAYTDPAERINVNKHCSLNICYTKNNVYFKNIEIQLYHVADVSSNHVYTLTDKFKKYPVEMSNVSSQTEWNSTAVTLESYIIADAIIPTQTSVTDENGIAAFKDLKVGMYLVRSVITTQNNKIYKFGTFLISMPNINDGKLEYNVEAFPKCEVLESPDDPPSNNRIKFKAVKQWADSGNSDKRPSSVQIEIFKNGVSVETQTLSNNNDWMYTWTAEDDGSNWTVVERNVPKGYTVTSVPYGFTFVLTNYCIDTPKPVIDNPPNTGGFVNLKVPYTTIIMLILGLLFTIVGLVSKRKMKNGKE